MVGPWSELSSLGDSVWADAVHLSDSGYLLVAKMVLKTGSELSSKPDADVEASRKRRSESSAPAGRVPDHVGFSRPPPPWQQRGRRRY